jgi:NAD(P)H-dependent FMN reductase
MAEHNGNYSASFKNVLTGVLEFRVRFFKAMLLMASSRAKGGASALEIAKKAFPFYGGNIKATFFISSFDDNFDLTNAKISNAELDEQLKEIVRDFQM